METRKEMECIQCIARDANKAMFSREDLGDYEKDLKRARMKREGSVMEKRTTLKRTTTNASDLSG